MRVNPILIFKPERRVKLLVAVFFISFVASRLYALGGGLNVLEPDEWDYQHIAGSLRNYSWPRWHGEVFLSKYPAFVFLGYGLGLAFPQLFRWGPYVNLRLIAVFSDAVFLVAMGLLLRRYHISKLLTVMTLLICLFILLHWFYSRTGTYEMWHMAFAAVSLLTFVKWREKPTQRNSVWMGITSALALLAKHVNVLLLISYAALVFIKWRDFRRDLRLIILSGASTIVTLIIGLLPLLYYRNQFYAQFFRLYEGFFVFQPRAFVAIWWEYFKLSPYWLSWPIVGLSLLGLVTLVKNYKRWPEIILLIVVEVMYLGSYYINARSFVLVLLIIMVLVGWGLERLQRSLRSACQITTVVVLLLSAMFLQGRIAFESSLHISYEKALETIRLIKKEKATYSIFDTIDPKKTAGSLPEYSVRLLNKEATRSAIVLADELKTPLMLNLTEPEFRQARETFQIIRQKYSPQVIINDPWPHFPGSDKNNAYSIYVIN